MILMVFATDWWRNHFKPVICHMPLNDIRNPANLNPSVQFGPGSKRGRGDGQNHSDLDSSGVRFQINGSILKLISYTANNYISFFPDNQQFNV